VVQRAFTAQGAGLGGVGPVGTRRAGTRGGVLADPTGRAAGRARRCAGEGVRDAGANGTGKAEAPGLAPTVAATKWPTTQGDAGGTRSRGARGFAGAAKAGPRSRLGDAHGSSYLAYFLVKANWAYLCFRTMYRA
jgi:hypothetical protein